MSPQIGFLIAVMIVMVIFHVYYSTTLTNVDTFILALACGILVFYYWDSVKIEQFSSADDAMIKLEEDISAFKNAVVYLSAFNKKSYTSGKTWTSIASPINTKVGCGGSGTFTFTFDAEPAYDRKSGFILNTQTITCPYSCALGIEYHSTYTIAISFKVRDLSVAGNKAIEILKLFGNSPTNNGLALTIPAESITNTTTGLVLEVAEKSFICTQDSSVDIPIEKDLLVFYFIVKDTEGIKVVSMNEKTNTQTTLFSITDPFLANTKVNFSNKEMLINSTKNWNVNIVQFAIFNTAFTSVQVADLYTHMLNIYKKNKDEQYLSIANNYNALLANVAASESCPYDTATCSKCADFKDWKAPLSVVTKTSSECKKAINTYCSTNPLDNKCGGCWDTKSVAYNNDTCKMTRTFFSSPDDVHGKVIEGLSASDIEIVKSKYSLIASSDCPKPVTIKEDELEPVTRSTGFFARMVGK